MTGWRGCRPRVLESAGIPAHWVLGHRETGQAGRQAGQGRAGFEEEEAVAFLLTRRW